jgi:hypothetical protein
MVTWVAFRRERGHRRVTQHPGVVHDNQSIVQWLQVHHKAGGAGQRKVRAPEPQTRQGKHRHTGRHPARRHACTRPVCIFPRPPCREVCGHGLQPAWGIRVWRPACVGPWTPVCKQPLLRGCVCGVGGRRRAAGGRAVGWPSEWGGERVRRRVGSCVATRALRHPACPLRSIPRCLAHSRARRHRVANSGGGMWSWGFTWHGLLAGPLCIPPYSPPCVFWGPCQWPHAGDARSESGEGTPMPT